MPVAQTQRAIVYEQRRESDYRVHRRPPVIHIIALANGKANYSITKPKPPSAPKAFKLSLEKYTIDNGTIVYDDRGLGFYMALKGMNHNGSGEMTADVYAKTLNL